MSADAERTASFRRIQQKKTVISVALDVKLFRTGEAADPFGIIVQFPCRLRGDTHVLCMLGAFALNNRTFDVWALLFFGLVGFALSKFKVPLPPLILGFVLGNTFETNLRRGLQVSNGSFMGVFASPIAAVFMIVAILSIIFQVISYMKKKKAN